MVTVVALEEKTCICGRCKSTLKYFYNEVQNHKTNYDYTGDYDIVRGIKCPVCNNIVKDK